MSRNEHTSPSSPHDRGAQRLNHAAESPDLHGIVIPRCAGVALADGVMHHGLIRASLLTLNSFFSGVLHSDLVPDATPDIPLDERIDCLAKAFADRALEMGVLQVGQVNSFMEELSAGLNGKPGASKRVNWYKSCRSIAEARRTTDEDLYGPPVRLDWIRSFETGIDALLALAARSCQYERTGDGYLNGGAYGSVAFQNVNQTLRVSDEFMEAVEKGTRSPLYDVKGNMIDTIDANEVLQAVAEGTHFCSDPGIQYADTISAWHTVPEHGPINSSNPDASARGDEAGAHVSELGPELSASLLLETSE